MNARAELLEPADNRARSLAKAVSYRLLATIVMAAVAWALTHRFAVAAALAGADSLFKTVLFYLHERLWTRIGVGRRHATGVQRCAIVGTWRRGRPNRRATLASPRWR
jgi:uncharacterized membrane protein